MWASLPIYVDFISRVCGLLFHLSEPSFHVCAKTKRKEDIGAVKRPIKVRCKCPLAVELIGYDGVQLLNGTDASTSFAFPGLEKALADRC